MPSRPRSSLFFPAFGTALGRTASEIGSIPMRAGTRLLRDAVKARTVQRRAATGSGDWIAGIAVGPAGVRRYRLFRPPGIAWSRTAAADGDAARLQPGRGVVRRQHAHEPHRRAAAFPGALPRAGPHRPPGRLLELVRHRAPAGRTPRRRRSWRPIDQVLLLYPADRARVAVAGLSAGASMAALLATRHARALPGGGHAFGHSAGHGAFDRLGARRHARRWRPTAAGGVARAAAAAAGASTAADDAGRRLRATAAPPRCAWAEARRRASRASARVVQRGRRHMTVTDFRARRRTVATLCEIDGLGHAWSGGDRQPALRRRRRARCVAAGLDLRGAPVRRSRLSACVRARAREAASGVPASGAASGCRQRGDAVGHAAPRRGASAAKARQACALPRRLLRRVARRAVRAPLPPRRPSSPRAAPRRPPRRARRPAAKLKVCGPISTGQPQAAASIRFWPPSGSKLPPSSATSASP